jgi:uncharacterized glyoxalase superfamily protein PhnB
MSESFAPMPNLEKSNLENLKKQAKQYLRWHRERYYPVAARIRAALPRFCHHSDAQVLDANFKLADAQELVARERGFEGWQALESGAYAMSDEKRAEKRELRTPGAKAPIENRQVIAALKRCATQNQSLSPNHETAHTAARPILNSTEAQLFVADIKASCDFYTEKLGFTVAFVYGDPPYYAQVTRDHARLNLRVVGEPVFVGDIREREGLLSATLTVATKDEVKPLFLSYQAAGVRFGQTLKKEPWGARTFIVVDRDGNLILFAGPAD